MCLRMCVCVCVLTAAHTEQNCSTAGRYYRDWAGPIGTRALMDSVRVMMMMTMMMVVVVLRC
jgi:hypothetical protein